MLRLQRTYKLLITGNIVIICFVASYEFHSNTLSTLYEIRLVPIQFFSAPTHLITVVRGEVLWFKLLVLLFKKNCMIIIVCWPYWSKNWQEKVD